MCTRPGAFWHSDTRLLAFQPGEFHSLVALGLAPPHGSATSLTTHCSTCGYKHMIRHPTCISILLAVSRCFFEDKKGGCASLRGLSNIFYCDNHHLGERKGAACPRMSSRVLSRASGKATVTVPVPVNSPFEFHMLPGGVLNALTAAFGVTPAPSTRFGDGLPAI